MVNAELLARLEDELKQVREAEMVAWRKVLYLDGELLNAQNTWYSQEVRDLIYSDYCKYEKAHERLVEIDRAVERTIVALRGGNYQLIAEGLA